MVLMPLLSRLLTLLVILTMPLFLARLTLIPIKSLSICRSEERFSRNAETDLVCRLLLEKKKRMAMTCNANSGAEPGYVDDIGSTRAVHVLSRGVAVYTAGV